MSGSPATPGKSHWSEYKNSEGRVYWSHAITKQSVWEKPDELRTPFERALAKTSWKQYVSKDRPYYVNSITKETKWDLPAELVALKKKVEAIEEWKIEREKRKAKGLDRYVLNRRSTNGSPTPPPRSRSPTPEHLRASDSNALAPFKPLPPTGPANMYPPRGPRQPADLVWPIGGFLTHEKAEEAFIRLLKHEGIDETWSWDATMRKIIMHPFYKALDTMAEKKAAFEKYTRSIIEDRRAAKEARITRLRPILHKLFAATPTIKRYSTMKTADPFYAYDRNWREALPDERRLLLEEYTDQLKKAEINTEKELRDRNIETLSTLIKTLDLTVSTRWRAAHDIIVSSEEFRKDKGLQQIETVDILGVYDNYSRLLEKEHEEESRKFRISEARRARKAREGYKSLLGELQENGKLSRSTKWKEIYPLIKGDKRYKDLLGLPGSNPLDLWMDVVDDMGEETERAAEKIGKAFKGVEKAVVLETTQEQFEEWIKEVHMDTQIDLKLRKEVYNLLHDKLAQAAADEQRRAERKRRHRMEDLRYALRKVKEIELEMTFEQAEPHIKDLQEYKDVTEEEDRKIAYDKFIKRQKEKLKEAEGSDAGSVRSPEKRYSKMEVEESGEKEKERSSRSSRRESGRENGDRYGHERRESYGDKRDRRGDKRDDDRYRSDRRDRDDKYRERDHRRDSRREKKHYSESAEPEDRDSKRPRISEEKNGMMEIEEGEI